MNYYIVDVIKTYKALILHQPIFTNSLLHPFLLTAKMKYLMGKDQLWYMNISIGKNTLCLLNKRLTNDLPSLKGQLQIKLVEVYHISNGRCTCSH